MKSIIRIEKLEDLLVWCKARDLNTQIYKITGKGPFGKDYPLRDQIRRAAISISSNIAEGFGRYSKKEYANFLSIAAGSASEVKSQILLAHELRYVDKEESERISEFCMEICRMVTGLRRKIVDV